MTRCNRILSNALFSLSADVGGEHALQRLPRRRLSGVPEARGIRAQERPAHINRSDPCGRIEVLLLF